MTMNPTNNQRTQRSVDRAIEPLEPRRLCSVSFATRPALNVGASPTDGVYADVNNDAKLDLIVSNGALGTRGFGVFLGDGTGAFTPGQRTTTTDIATSLVAFDYTHDGNIDIGLATRSTLGTTAKLSLFRGNGNGTFTRVNAYTIPADTVHMISADMNGDGLFDAITVNALNGSVSVLLATLNGGLESPRTQVVGITPSDAVSGDFNEDGKADLIVQSLLSLKFFPGHGDGTFGSATTIRLLPQLGTILTGAKLSTHDLNGDGHLDLAVPGLSTVATTLHGDGTGAFDTGAVGGMVPNAVIVATAAVDLDGNGTNDVVSVDNNSGKVVVNLLDTVGAITDTTTYAAGIAPSVVTLADFNGDGKNDIISFDPSGATANVLINASTAAAVSLIDLSKRTIWLPGTAAADTLTVRKLHTQAILSRGGIETSVTLADFRRLEVVSGIGNDRVDLSTFDRPVYVQGGEGNDTIIGGLSNDRLRGGTGNDSITGGLGNDRIEGWKGSDVLIGGDGDDRIYGYDGNDRLEGSSGRDRLHGELGNDTLSGGSSNDRLYGGLGDDLLYGNTGLDSFDGGIGGRDRGDMVDGELTYSVELANGR